MSSWTEVHPNKFTRQIGNQLETRERYYAPHCRELNINFPVEINEFSITTNSTSVFTYSIKSIDEGMIWSHNSQIPIFQEHHKLMTLEALYLHNLLFS